MPASPSIGCSCRHFRRRHDQPHLVYDDLRPAGPCAIVIVCAGITKKPIGRSACWRLFRHRARQNRQLHLAPLQMSPAGGRAFGCFFPMPFSERALLKIPTGVTLSCFLLLRRLRTPRQHRRGLRALSRAVALLAPDRRISDEGMVNTGGRSAAPIPTARATTSSASRGKGTRRLQPQKPQPAPA